MAVKTPFRTYTNDQGRTFAVKYLPTGARYGRSSFLANEDAPMVEFYDVTHADDGVGGDTGDGFGPLGQFVTRFHLLTLLNGDHSRTGLDLMGRVDEWTIHAATMGRVLAWLRTLGNTWDDGQVAEFVAAYLDTAAELLAARERMLSRPAVHEDAAATLTRYARGFYDANASDLATWFSPESAGYDLWETGARKGDGFWTRHLGPGEPSNVFSAKAAGWRYDPSRELRAEFEYAKTRLTNAARMSDERRTYLGDDQRLHLV